MATKKQKREAGLAKHETFMANVRETGLKALRKDQERRRQKELDDWRENHNKRHSWKKRIKECPHCRIELAQARQASAG